VSSKLINLPDLERPHTLPPEIYLPLVHSLYQDTRTLLAGTFLIIGSMLTTYWKSDEPLLLGCALTFLIVAALRGVCMYAYACARAMIKTNEIARVWELRYVIGAATSVGLLGAWCFIAFAKTSDQVTHLIAFSMSIAYLVGIFGRNFANSRFVVVQILCAWAPMTAALLLYGNPYHWIFAGLLIPFFLAVKFIAERLRRTLLKALVISSDMSMLVNRFDTALNNMPQGLCMFDANRRLVVSNRRTAEFLNLTFDLTNGMCLDDFLFECARAGAVESTQLGSFRAAFEHSLLRRQQFFLTTKQARFLAFTFEPMGNGGLVVLVDDITERRNAEAKINLARYDHLTGLPNRMFFRDRVVMTLAGMQPSDCCALLFLDLDDFKRVNDTLGHSCGDKLLCVVADRLRKATGESDVVARLAGDEFVVFRSPVAHTDEASTLARHIVERLEEPCEIDGHQVTATASIGVAVGKHNSADIEVLLENADMALYRAKSEGGSAWRLFESEMNVRACARRNLEADLRNVLRTGGFELWYQPIINLRSQRISTCEALLRWPHPTRGMIPPTEFIPIAEDMGLIIELGKWVLSHACSECARWPGDVSVAVNLSPVQFRRGNVVSTINEALAQSGLAPNRLEIEITESALLPDTKATRLCLEQISDLGVGISLDDFGTGYSSLSYLHSFPLDKIKIDSSFLQGIESNPRSLTLLRGVARLSAELGMTVTVEGIESDAHLALISAERNIDEAQGFLFSPAMPGRQIATLLSLAPRRGAKVA
jgi:diguanylate cyclase (GGDEF)-like protein